MTETVTSTVARRQRGRVIPLTILITGLLVFAAFSIACWVLYDQTEQRLLEERADEAAAVLTVAVGQVRIPLNAAATLAEVTDGNPAAFEDAMSAYVGPEQSFTGAGLFAIDSTTPITTLGSIGLGEDEERRLAELFTAAEAEPFVIVNLLSSGRRLGYGVVDSATNPRFLVYGERTLSPDPNVRRRTDEPFADLDYAIYVGTEEVGSALLGSSLSDLPIEGRRAAVTAPFGDTQLLLVMTPIGHLTSGLFAHLWWIIALIGIGTSTAAGWLSRRLIVQHDEALALATDNERLYAEQREIAETLQLSLLPQVLEPPPGGELAARYWPAGTASLIGGDFYDAFRVDDDRWAVTIGDVCGKGIEAAAITGLARHTIRAAARHLGSPSEVLSALHLAMADHLPSTFCTVCFLFIDPQPSGGARVEMSLGGHPRPFLRRADSTVSEVGQPGTLLGMVEPTLHDTVVEVAPGDTLVLYTDGLTDAPGSQAVPVEELVDLLRADGAMAVEPLADSIRVLKRRRRPQGSADDTVVMVLRFGAPGPGAAADGADISREPADASR
ncbi:MAG: PP2C family protein-serine/threonine phosphatase [Ilumatobacteraceae bacterium]